MKKYLFIMMCSLLASSLVGCSSDGDEKSANPQRRIVGSWKLVKENERDVSSQDVILTFKEDGTWFTSGPTVCQEQNSQEEWYEVKQVVSFDEDWGYDAKKDVILGYLDLRSPSVGNFPYRFELKRKELLISFEPRGAVYFVAPSPHVCYYVRQ